MTRRYVPTLGRSITGATHYPPSTKVSSLSFSSTPINFLSNDGARSLIQAHATGFIWQRNSRLFLITNRHVVTGRDNFTGEILCSTGFIPSTIRIYIAFQILLNDNMRSINRIPVQIDLYNEDDSPVWLEHPNHEIKADVVCVPIPLIKSADNLSFYKFNEYSFSDLFHFVGHDVFVIGFPFGNFEGPAPAIWKRASYAHEPLLAFDGRPLFLVDGLTSQGMSGSPCVRVQFGPAIRADLTQNLHNVVTTDFVGVYSGRVVSAEHPAASLGLVWSKHLIEDIFQQTC